MTKIIKPGDIVAVPLSQNKVAVGLVLHISKIFGQGGMLIGFFSEVFKSINDIKIQDLRGVFVRTPNYTSRKLITDGRWQVVGNDLDLLSRVEIPLLRVTNRLYFKDDEIRVLSREEVNQFPEVLGEGYQVIEDALRSYSNHSNEL